MATNDFLVFGGGSSPNVIDQATYAALAARLSGFQSGTALSAQLNKVWRQSSIMAAVLAQFTANFSGQNAVDDGTTATLLANLQAAINAAGITAPQFDSSTKLATTAFVGRAAGNFQTRKYVSGSATLVPSDTGSWIEAGGTGPSTITLPDPATINLTYTVTNVTSNGTPVTISTPSGAIYNQASASSSFSLDVGATVELVSDASNWTVISHYTRSPIAQTPAQFDNSTKLATTAFVQRSLGSLSGFAGINSNTTLTNAQAGQAIQNYANASVTVTLPLSSTMPIGSCITFFNNGSAGSVMTVATQGSDTITTPGVSVSSVPIQLGDTLQVMSRGTAEWDIVGGSAAIQYSQTRGVTAPLQDGSTKLSTTAFVKSWLQGVTTTTGISANTTLNQSAFGQAIIVTAGTPTITLPAASSGANGQGIVIANDGGSPTGYATVAAAGSDTISNVGTSINLVLGESLVLVTNGAQWWPIGGTAMLKKTQRVLVNTVADDGSSALQVGGIAKASTPVAGDNGASLATTAFVNGTGGVVGTARNAQMSVSAVSASATFSADEIVVETALGGAPIRLANFNQKINLATVGAGGMDTGTAPVSGFVALYAIYNPTTRASALLATNSTGSVSPNVYNAGFMPAGYTASALVSVWPTNASSLFAVGMQDDRKVWITPQTALSTSTQQSSLTPLSISSLVPKGAKRVSGNCVMGSSSATASVSAQVAGSSQGFGSQQLTAYTGFASQAYTVPFNDVPLFSAQTVYYSAVANTGTASLTISITAYTF